MKEDALRPYPDEQYQQHLAELEDGEILHFSDGDLEYHLFHNKGSFTLHAHFGEKGFDSLESFWSWLVDEGGLMRFNSLGHIPKAFAKHIIEHNNTLRKKQQFTYKEYLHLHFWENGVYEQDLSHEFFWQQCAHCKKRVTYMARYPKHLCHACTTLITDKDDRGVEFFNTGAMGTGCQGYYKGTKGKELYPEYYCYIGNEKYRATEGRFGGIYIERIEN